MVLALQLEEVFKEKVKERMLSGKPVLKSEQGTQISANPIEIKPIETRKKNYFFNIEKVRFRHEKKKRWLWF